MADVIRVFDEVIFLQEMPYEARVVGRPQGHVWEGWIEFIADDGSDVRRTPRETTQSDRLALLYWASGLSSTYLEGALQRAVRATPRGASTPQAWTEGPAPGPAGDGFGSDVPRSGAVLDPFSVAAKGEHLLRRELGALHAWHLRNIARAYALTDGSVDLERLTQAELIELIVAGVQPA